MPFEERGLSFEEMIFMYAGDLSKHQFGELPRKEGTSGNLLGITDLT